MAENEAPLDSKKDKRLKKPFATWLSERAAVARGKWGAFLGNPAGTIGSLLASKTALVAMALALTALAGLATMARKTDTGPAYSSSFGSYKPGPGGSDLSSFPLPYAEGNKSYLDELLKASMAPEPAREILAEAAEEYGPLAKERAASSPQGLAAKGGFAASSGGSSSSSGASIVSLPAATRDKEQQARREEGMEVMGAGGRGVAIGAGRGNTVSGNRLRAAHKGGSPLANRGLPQGNTQNLERAKALSNMMFGETPAAATSAGMQPSGMEGSGAPADSEGSSSPVLPSEQPQQGGGSPVKTPEMPAGGAPSTVGSADMEAQAQQLSDLALESDQSLKNLLDLSKDPEQLCKGGATNAAIQDVFAKGNAMLTQMTAMEASGAINAETLSQWKCGVVMKMFDAVNQFTQDIKPYCQAYVDMKWAEEQVANKAWYAPENLNKLIIGYEQKKAVWAAAEPTFAVQRAPMAEFESKMQSNEGIKQLVDSGSRGDCLFDTQCGGGAACFVPPTPNGMTFLEGIKKGVETAVDLAGDFLVNNVLTPIISTPAGMWVAENVVIPLVESPVGQVINNAAQAVSNAVESAWNWIWGG